MENITSTLTDNILTISLSGHIDSSNAADADAEIKSLCESSSPANVIVDAAALEYISSAGLRIMLKIKKAYKDFSIINVSNEVYEIFEMTGFTEMMTIEKAYRQISIDGCKVLGKGSNGIVYRIDPETVIKLYFNPDCLPDIKRERELAHKAFVMGIPTAISFDIVKVGDSYGSIFELVDAQSMSQALAKDPSRLDELAKIYVDILKLIHSTEVAPNTLPSMKEVAVRWVGDLNGSLPDEYYSKLVKLADEIPEDNHMLHGDYHTNNVMMEKSEPLLIDMDTLCVGNPIFELGSIYMAYYGFHDLDKEDTVGFLEMKTSLGKQFFDKAMELYFDTTDKAFIESQLNKARVVCYTRLLRRTMRRRASIENADEAIAVYTQKLKDAIDSVDTLILDKAPKIYERTFPAKIEYVEAVTDFTNDCLQKFNCNLKAQNQIDIVIDEIFSNIANYANIDGTVEALIRVKISEKPLTVEITFIDGGKAYDPTSGPDPDITLSAEDRTEGGLGMFIVKNLMDEITYEYKDGHNILTVKKTI